MNVNKIPDHLLSGDSTNNTLSNLLPDGKHNRINAQRNVDIQRYSIGIRQDRFSMMEISKKETLKMCEKFKENMINDVERIQNDKNIKEKNMINQTASKKKIIDAIIEKIGQDFLDDCIKNLGLLKEDILKPLESEEENDEDFLEKINNLEKVDGKAVPVENGALQATFVLKDQYDSIEENEKIDLQVAPRFESSNNIISFKNNTESSVNNQKKLSWNFLTAENLLSDTIIRIYIHYFSNILSSEGNIRRKVGRPRKYTDDEKKKSPEENKKFQNALCKRKKYHRKKPNAGVTAVPMTVNLMRKTMKNIQILAVYALYMISCIKRIYVSNKKAIPLKAGNNQARYQAIKRHKFKNTVFKPLKSQAEIIASSTQKKIPELTSNNTTLSQRDPNLPTCSKRLGEYEPYSVTTITNLKRKSDYHIHEISIGMKDISKPFYNDQQNVDTKKRKMENSNDGGTPTEMINLRNYALRLLGVFKETTPNSFALLCLEKKEVIRCKKCPYGENKPPTYLRLLDLSLYDKDWSMQDMIEALQQERRSDSCPDCKESLFTKVNLSIPNYTKALLVKPPNMKRLPKKKLRLKALQANVGEYEVRMDPVYAIVEVEGKLMLIRMARGQCEKMVEEEQWIAIETPTNALFIIYQRRNKIP